MRQYNIHTKLSKQFNLPLNTIKHLCGCEFKFILDRMMDDTDNKDILLKGLFRFKRKTRFCKYDTDNRTD